MAAKPGVRRNPDVVWRGETKGGNTEGALRCNDQTRDIHFLEGQGGRIWEQCEGKSIDEIYSLTNGRVSKDDVIIFLKSLRKRGLIVIPGEHPETKVRGMLPEPGEGMWRQRTYLDAPLFVQFDCTNKCNLRCRHCVTSGGNPAEGELSTPEAVGLIEELGEIGVFQIGFSGGEPLAREDVFTLMKTVKDHGMKVQLTTNATLVNRDTIGLLKEINPVTVGVSLEGGYKESYEYFRGKGNFERFQKGVREMVESGLPVKFKTAVMRRNLGEINPIINLAMDMDVEAVDMFLFYPQGRGKEFSREMLKPLEIRNFLKSIKENRE